MKIRYVKGDILEAPEFIIAHGCNAQGVMGSGVAAAIRGKYPNAYNVYSAYHKNENLTMGNVVWSFPDVPAEPIVGNCITQEFFGGDGKKYVDYYALRKCMQKLDALAYAMDFPAVALPKIGAGLAGGDWDIIEEIIEESFIIAEPVVYVLE